jgi:hypothetical protein
MMTGPGTSSQPLGARIFGRGIVVCYQDKCSLKTGPSQTVEDSFTKRLPSLRAW